MACQLLMPTTAADTLIPHTPAGQRGWGGSTASLRGRGGSRELLQLQQQVGGSSLVRRSGMCHGLMAWPWMGALTTDSVVNDRITLHGDDARCVCGRVTHSEQMNVGGGKEQRNRVSQRLTASIVECCETRQSVCWPVSVQYHACTQISNG